MHDENWNSREQKEHIGGRPQVFSTLELIAIIKTAQVILNKYVFLDITPWEMANQLNNRRCLVEQFKVTCNNSIANHESSIFYSRVIESAKNISLFTVLDITGPESVKARGYSIDDTFLFIFERIA